jgi:4-carboxymuconolactone decarboxylase
VTDEDPAPGDPGPDDPYAALRARSAAGWEAVMRTPQEGLGAPPGSYPDLSNALLMGDLWQRPHLSLRERRLVVLTLLAAYGRPEPMAYHLRGALRSGDLDAAALEELVVQIAFYGGWPMSSTLFQAVQAAVADPGQPPRPPVARHPQGGATTPRDRRRSRPARTSRASASATAFACGLAPRPTGAASNPRARSAVRTSVTVHGPPAASTARRHAARSSSPPSSSRPSAATAGDVTTAGARGRSSWRRSERGWRATW